MTDELKEISKEMDKIREVFGIKAFQEIERYIYTLYRKIEDLIKSRDNWKNKFEKLKKGEEDE